MDERTGEKIAIGLFITALIVCLAVFGVMILGAIELVLWLTSK